jgi:hypothetical protein
MMRRRTVALVIAAALVVATIVGVVAIRNSGDDTSNVGAPTPSTSIAPTSTSTSTSSTSTTSTTAPPVSLVATIDLTAALPRLEPHQILSTPIQPPGDLFPTAYAATAPNDRIALLDDVTGVVRFLDGTTRMDITQYPTDVPKIGSQTFISGDFFVGPDDVLYVNEGGGDTPTLVAYGRVGDRYVEVARTPHGVGDGVLMLGRTGVSEVGVTDPIMAYVGVNGQPSGATLGIDALSVTNDSKDVYTIQRGSSTWTVTYVFPPDAGLPPSDGCVLCASVSLGPGATAVLVNQSPDAGGDLKTKLTVLSDQVTTYDTDWHYVGVLDGKMLFDRLDQDSIDLGTAEI